MANHNEMMTYSFELDNFSQRNDIFKTPIFSNGSCNWYVYGFPKGDIKSTNKNLSLWLQVPDPHSRPLYWSRQTSFRFVVVNPSDVNSSRSFKSIDTIFNKEVSGWGFRTDSSLSKLQEGKFLVNDKLKVEVYIGYIYVHGGLDPLPEKEKETVCVNGFQVLDTQVKSAKWIFETFPETALYIRPQDPQLKTAYMNILIRIYETLYNSPLEKLTEGELSNVSKGLLDLTQAGFKLEWLREKLEKVSVERKKLSDYRELEKQLKNLELMMCNLKAEIKLKAES